MKYILFAIMLICTLIILALFITAVIVGSYWLELSEYPNKGDELNDKLDKE